MRGRNRPQCPVFGRVVIVIVANSHAIAAAGAIVRMRNRASLSMSNEAELYIVAVVTRSGREDSQSRHGRRLLRGDRKTRPDFLIADARGGLLLTDHTIVNPLAASRAARTAASTLEDVVRVKDKYADDAKNMGATFTPLVCSVYGLLSARASDAHVNPIGGRKAFINLLLSAVSRHPEVQRRHHPHGPAEDPRCFVSSSRPDGHPPSLPVCSFTSWVLVKESVDRKMLCSTLVQPGAQFGA